jgi:benzodiazapine receptor
MSTAQSVIGLVGWLLVTLAAGGIGSRYLPGPWYASLAKPAWNPPNAVFGPVWAVLYVMMGLAAWRAWSRAGFAGAGPALALFVLQLGLNALWSYLFFGRHRPDLAFLDIVALWGALLAVVVLFWRVDHGAGALMLPCLAWVGFAAFLNLALWRLNGP